MRKMTKKTRKTTTTYYRYYYDDDYYDYDLYSYLCLYLMNDDDDENENELKTKSLRYGQEVPLVDDDYGDSDVIVNLYDDGVRPFSFYIFLILLLLTIFSDFSLILCEIVKKKGRKMTWFVVPNSFLLKCSDFFF
jgi:hypothetical protein